MSAPLMTRTGPTALEIYHRAQELDAFDGPVGSYAGSTVRAGAKALLDWGRIASYLWAWEARPVADWLLSGKGGVVLGTAWFGGMLVPDKRGFVTPTGRLVGRHAWFLVGYNEARGVFRLLNSWGTTWGQGGRAWITGEHLDSLLANRGEACAAIECPPPSPV